jgi:hypothetical protein
MSTRARRLGPQLDAEHRILAESSGVRWPHGDPAVVWLKDERAGCEFAEIALEPDRLTARGVAGHPAPCGLSSGRARPSIPVVDEGSLTGHDGGP